MKKLLSIILSLALVFALVPSLVFTASADDSVVANLSKGIEYTTLKSAVSAASDGDELKLLADITTGTGEKEGGAAKSFSLDMDGHTIVVPGSRFLSVDIGKTVTFANGNILFDVAGSFNMAIIVRESSTLNLTDVNVSMSDSCKTPSNGFISMNKSANDSANYVNITRCHISSKSSVFNFSTLTKYVVTVTDSTLTGSGVFANTRTNDEGTVTVSNSSITNNSNFNTTALSTVVVADGEDVFDSSDNAIEGAIADGRKLAPSVIKDYSSITIKKAGVIPVESFDGIAGETIEEAQLRVGNSNGIRFTTLVDADKVAAAKAAGYTVTLGTIVAPVDLTSGEMTFESGVSQYIDIVADGYFKNESGKVAGSIVSIKAANIKRNFIARGYVKLTKNDETTVYYATQPNAGRSLKTVALACVADSSFFGKLNDAQKTQVTAWANA